MKIGLGHKIAAFTSALIILIVAGLFSVMVYKEQATIHNLRMEETQVYVQQTASQADDHLYNLDIRALRSVVSSALKGGNADLMWVLDDQGRLLTDGSELPELRNQKPPYPFVDKIMAANGPTHAMDGHLHWIGTDVHLADGKVLGYIVSAFSSERLDARLRSNLINQFIVLGPALLIGIVLAFFFGRRLARPLESLSRAAEQIGSGSWDVHIDSGSSDEVGDLARSIKAMAENLSQNAVSRDKMGAIIAEKTLELKRHQEHLEDLVEERTRELAKSEERFRGFAESSSDWFWEMDDQLRVSYLSDRFEDVTGNAASTVLGKTRREIADPEMVNRDPGKWLRHLEDLDARRPFRNFEYDMAHAPGEPVTTLSISGVPFFDEHGTFQGYRGSGEDVTERNAIAAELRKNEQKFRSIVQTTSEGYWLIDPDSKKNAGG